jgi:hypothetical protein
VKHYVCKNTLKNGHFFQKLNVGYRISLNILVRYRNARQIVYLSVRYRKVRQRLSPISLITDVGLSAHLWRNITANSNFKENSATFPILMYFFFIVTDRTKTQLFTNFSNFNRISCPHSLKIKFCYFSATFVKLDSGADIKKPPLLVLIFR